MEKSKEKSNDLLFLFQPSTKIHTVGFECTPVHPREGRVGDVSCCTRRSEQRDNTSDQSSGSSRHSDKRLTNGIRRHFDQITAFILISDVLIIVPSLLYDLVLRQFS